MLAPLSKLNVEFTKTHKLLYGYPKTGKTTLAAGMIDAEGRTPLFLATEEGHGSIAVSKFDIKSWPGFLKCIDFLEKEQVRLRAEHSCIVVDHLSDLDLWLSTEVAKQKNVEYVGDMEQGKGWKLIREQLGAALTRLLNLMPITFIAHSADKRVSWNGEQIVTQGPSLGKAALEFVNGKVDVIMFIQPATTKKEFPELTMKQSSSHIAGARQKAICQAFKFDPANPTATFIQIANLYRDAQAAEQAKLDQGKTQEVAK